MRVLLCCIPFFPELDAEVHPSKPSDDQKSVLPESTDCVLPLESR